MNDLIIFLSFIIFMTLSVCWIQAIQIEKLKERIKGVKNNHGIWNGGTTKNKNTS
jgi:hypothetical protein